MCYISTRSAAASVIITKKYIAQIQIRVHSSLASLTQMVRGCERTKIVKLESELYTALLLLVFIRSEYSSLNLHAQNKSK